MTYSQTQLGGFWCITPNQAASENWKQFMLSFDKNKKSHSKHNKKLSEKLFLFLWHGNIVFNRWEKKNDKLIEIVLAFFHQRYLFSCLIVPSACISGGMGVPQINRMKEGVLGRKLFTNWEWMRTEMWNEKKGRSWLCV